MAVGVCKDCERPLGQFSAKSKGLCPRCLALRDKDEEHNEDNVVIRKDPWDTKQDKDEEHNEDNNDNNNNDQG